MTMDKEDVKKGFSELLEEGVKSNFIKGFSIADSPENTITIVIKLLPTVGENIDTITT